MVEGAQGDQDTSEAVFRFAANEEASFECAMDGGAMGPCESPAAFARLALGPHTFSVRAVDRAVNADGSPAVARFTVTAITPETRITRAPHSPWREPTAELEFEADLPGSTYECQLDDEPRVPCVSPVAYDNLIDGRYAFRVWATDPSGRVDPTPAAHDFMVMFEYW
jgi:hypothetical protein